MAAYLAHLGLLDVTGELSVRQGDSMKRPTTITARIQANTDVAVSGSADLSAQGWLRGPSPR